MKTKISLFVMLAAVLAWSVNTFADGKRQSVYQYVVSPADVDIDQAVQLIEARADEYGYRVLASFEAGTPEKCNFRAHVMALFNPGYGRQLMVANSQTAPFAVVDRVNIFEDENGVHVSIVNPKSINRTVLMDDPSFKEITDMHTRDLRKLLADAVPGTPSEKSYGQERKKGYIGRTMGVMAGGKFIDKLQDKAVLAGADLQEVAAKLQQGLSEPGTGWGMHVIYKLSLPEFNTVVLGVTGTPMDSKSFSIVGAGSDKSRKNLSCPGLAHAAAYPMSVVVYKEGDQLKIRLVDTMYRMKMYFEDAGKWAFMKNMGMPGSIEDEIVSMINNALADDGLSTLD